MTDSNDDDDDILQPSRRVCRIRRGDRQSNPNETQPRRRPLPEPVAAPKPQKPTLQSGGGAQVEREVEQDTQDAADDGKRGYGRPPRHSRFQKGRSGNPRGRPKSSRSLKTYLLKILDEVVEVNEQGRKRKMTKREVIARQTVQQAMKGNLKSLAVITAFDPVEDDLPKQDAPLTEHEQAMMARYLGLVDDEESSDE